MKLTDQNPQLKHATDEIKEKNTQSADYITTHERVNRNLLLLIFLRHSSTT